MTTTQNKIESYNEMKSRHQKEISDFKGLFWAFGNEQFKEGMEEIGLKDNEFNKIVSIGAGGFILKTEVEAFKNLFKRHGIERKTRLKEEKLLIDALVYELKNHEYCITYDPTDALNSLGLTKNDVSPEVLKKACKISLAE